MGYRGVDKGWAWVVLPSSFLSGVLVAFLNYSTGVVNVALLEYFNKSVAATAVVGSIFTSFLCLFELMVQCIALILQRPWCFLVLIFLFHRPISSIMVSMTSCRVAHSIGGILCFLSFSLSFFADSLDVLILTYGVIGGIGTSLMAAPSIIVLGYSFDHYQGIAVGFAVAGAGLGMFISGPVTQSLLSHYGLQGTFLIMGAISSHGVAFGLLMRPSELEIQQKVKRKKHEEKSEEEKSSRVCAKRFIPTELLKNTIFWYLLIATLFWNVAYSIMLLHLPNFAVSVGAPETEGAFLITMVGLGSVVNRLLTGLSLSKGSGFDPFLLEFGFLVLAGIVTITFPLVSYSWTGREVFSVLFGIYSGGLITLFTPISVYLLGVGQLTAGIGGLYLASGIGYIIGPPLAGYMVDRLGTYEHSFYMSGSLLLLSSFVVLISSKWLKEVEEKRSEEESRVLDITRAEIMSGSSLFLSGSFNYIIEIEKQSLKHSSKRSLLCEVGEEKALTRGEPPVRCDIDISNGILRFAEIEEITDKNMPGVPSIVISPVSNEVKTPEVARKDTSVQVSFECASGFCTETNEIVKSKDSTIDEGCNVVDNSKMKTSHKNNDISNASSPNNSDSGYADESLIQSKTPQINNERSSDPINSSESELKRKSLTDFNDSISSEASVSSSDNNSRSTELSASGGCMDNADNYIRYNDHRVHHVRDIPSSEISLALEIPETGDHRADDFTETDVFLIKVK